MNKYDSVTLIGSGMTALTIAQYLKKDVAHLLLIDKAKGPGGRLANRRFENAAFDTGAQFIRARSPKFRSFLEPYIERQALKLWKYDEEQNPLYWGHQKMTSFPKALASDLQVKYSEEVQHLSFENNTWSILTNSHTTYQSTHLIITSPLPQTLTILSKSNIEIDRTQKTLLENIQYRKTLALLAFAHPDHSCHEAWLETPDLAHVDRLSNQKSKGNCDAPEALLFHFDHDFSTKWYDSDETTILKEMQNALADSPYQLNQMQVKKWKFADPFTTYGELFLKVAPTKNLYLAGDAFGGGSVEGAWRSAHALAEQLKSL